MQFNNQYKLLLYRLTFRFCNFNASQLLFRLKLFESQFLSCCFNFIYANMQLISSLFLIKKDIKRRNCAMHEEKNIVIKLLYDLNNNFVLLRYYNNYNSTTVLLLFEDVFGTIYNVLSKQQK